MPKEHIDDIFSTWDATGGLPGLFLTMADGGHAGTIKLHGPSRLAQLELCETTAASLH